MASMHKVMMSQSDALADCLSARSCRIVLESSPPDYVEKISRYLDSSQKNQDNAGNEPDEEGSDSGDSLFITQRPVPEAVRSGRKLSRSQRSDLTSPRYFEESDASASDSNEESKNESLRARDKLKLPKYSFPFLYERKWKPRSPLIHADHNRSLHRRAMLGFLQCARELQQKCQRGDDAESPLATVGMEGNDIDPLSEEEEERSEEEDIRVVERKCFVARAKAKSSKTWWNQAKEQKTVKVAKSRQKTSQETQPKALNKISPKVSKSKLTPLSVHTESVDDGRSSCRSPAEKKRSEGDAKRDQDSLAKSQTPNKKRYPARGPRRTLFQQKAQEEEMSDDSDATVCEPPVGESVSPPNDKESPTPAAEPQPDVLCADDQSQTGQTEDEPESPSFLQRLPDIVNDVNNDSQQNWDKEVGVEKKEVNKSEEAEMGQWLEEPEGPYSAKSANIVEETSSLLDNRAKLPTWQTSDELEYNERNCMELSSHDDTLVVQEDRHTPKPKQKKKKRDKTAAQSVRQEEDGNSDSDARMEDYGMTVNCSVEDGVKKKKKKRKREEDAEQLQSNHADEPLNDTGGLQIKKKKKKKDKSVVVAEEGEENEPESSTLDFLPMSIGVSVERRNGLESILSSEETNESCRVKKKKRKKKRQAPGDDAAQEGEKMFDVSLRQNPATLEESTGCSVKKKKMKKNVSDEVDIFDIPEENEKVEDDPQKYVESLEDQNPKKKKKKKKSEKLSVNASIEIGAQSDDSVSVPRKEKKRTSSFLVADAEKKDVETRGKEHCPSQCVEAPVWVKEDSFVRPGGFESAEVAGNLEEADGVVRRKKGKRKKSEKQDSVEKDPKHGCEEVNETCASPEATDKEVKRKKKKKHVADESEKGTPVKRLETVVDNGHCPTDNEVVRKKKKKKRDDNVCPVTEESPLTHAEDTVSEKSTLKTVSVDSPKKKAKRLSFSKHERGASIFLASNTVNQAAQESPNVLNQDPQSLETLGKQALKNKKDKKGMKSPTPPQDKPVTESAQLEPIRKKKKKRKKQLAVPVCVTSSPTLSEISVSKFEQSDSVLKEKHKKVKRKLYDSIEGFLTTLTE